MAILAALGTWFTGKFFNLKTVAVIIALLALGYGQYRFYNWSFDRGNTVGVASQQKTIDGLVSKLTQTTVSLTQTTDALNTWVGNYRRYVDASKKQVSDLKAAYAQSQAAYTKQLTSLQTSLAKTKQELQNATTTYISAFGNAGCTIPTGFVQLYNLSLQEAPAAGAASAASIALAGTSLSPYDVPSGLSLLDVTRVIVDNNNAAVANRTLVLGWQAWWRSVQSDFQKYQETHAQPPVAPPVSLLQSPKDIQRHVARSNDPILAPFQSWGVRAPFVDAR
jgi:hypothetical protein